MHPQTQVQVPQLVTPAGTAQAAKGLLFLWPFLLLLVTVVMIRVQIELWARRREDARQIRNQVAALREYDQVRKP
jgi:hypothetical protein